MLLLTLEAATEAAVNTVGRPPSLLLDRYKKEREREREREREKGEGREGRRGSGKEEKKKGQPPSKTHTHTQRMRNISPACLAVGLSFRGGGKEKPSKPSGKRCDEP